MSRDISPIDITPFTIAVPDDDLADLDRRLAATRWPEHPGGWFMGTDTDYLRGLVDHWRTGYDWRAQEAALNELPQFTADVDGRTIHFVHVEGMGPDPTPLLLTHGWPDTFARFRHVIPLLTDPAAHGGRAEDAFTVVAPSIPGFGFSGHEAMTSSAVADVWAGLMGALGHDRFVAAGGDVGSVITLALARQHPDRVTAIHLTDAGYPTGQEEDLGPEELEFAGFIQGWWHAEGAYAAVQSTKPQSIGVGLDDSPAGLAAWIVSMVATGASGEGPDAGVEAAFGGRDELLTNIALYWFTRTAASSARSYAAEAAAAWGPDAVPAGRATTPTGFTLFPREAPTPEAWVRRHADLVRYTTAAEGGHFAALELPEVYARELSEHFNSL